MSLILVDKTRTHKITVCETDFFLRSMSIGEKEKLVYAIQNINSVDDTESASAFEKLLDILCPVIITIGGYEKPVREILGQMEDFKQIKEIISAVVNHCNMTKDEAKNSDSSSK